MKRSRYIAAAAISATLGFIASVAAIGIIAWANDSQSWPDSIVLNIIYWLGVGPSLLLEEMGVRFEGELVVAIVLNPMVWAGAGILVTWVINKGTSAKRETEAEPEH